MVLAMILTDTLKTFRCAVLCKVARETAPQVTVVDLDVLATLVSHLVAHVRSVALAKLHQRLKITVLLDALLLLLVLRLHRAETSDARR